MTATPLIDPDTFFKERSSPSSLPPILLVSVFNLVVMGEQLLFVMSKLQYYRLSPSDSPVLFTVAMLFTLLTGIALWVIVSGMLALISYVFGGKGSLKRLTIYVGWGYLPVLIGSAAGFLITLYLIQSGISPQAITSSPPLIWKISEVINHIMVLWMGYIWVFAVKHARAVDFRNAVMTTLVPIGIYFGFVALGYVIG